MKQMENSFVEINGKFLNIIKPQIIKNCAIASLDIGSKSKCKETISISVITKSEMAELNKQFLQENHPTDVLAFPYSESWFFGRPVKNTKRNGEQENHLGDIFICFPIVEEQSKTLNTGLNLEINIMVAHGTLHLLGYDHETPDGQKEMIEKTVEIIKHLKLDHIKAKLSLEERNE